MLLSQTGAASSEQDAQRLPASPAADVGKGFWLLGFDRDGTCFEMCKISRSRAKEIMFDYGAYKLKDLDVTDFGDARYYYNEESADTGILLVH